HQFASAVIGGDMPIWVNEGLADYFGEAVYTGDSFVSGGVPVYRLKRIQEQLDSGKFKPVQRMMELSHRQWNAEMDPSNYDQAFAMVTFLAHGEDGRYQKAFGKFMVMLNRGTPWSKAWLETFGSAQGFEDRWATWWKSRPDDAFVDVYARATAQMLTSYLARATSQRQTFTDLAALTSAIEKGQVKWHKDDAMTPGLRTDCASLLKALDTLDAKIQLRPPVPAAPGVKPSPQTIVVTLKDGTIFTGTYKLKGNRVGSVDVKVTEPAAAAPSSAK
ncbi:MAG TPA: hypothetical protein VGB55_06205, partial [Tepidisphaeraceae bacterium]